MTANTAAQESSRSSPPSLVVTPLTGIEVSGLQGGPFSPAAFQYRVSASSGTVRYAIITPSWLTASSRFDTADTSGVVITLTVSPTATQLPPGTYRPHVAFRNVTNGHGSTDRIATLIVQAPSLSQSTPTPTPTPAATPTPTPASTPTPTPTATPTPTPTAAPGGQSISTIALSQNTTTGLPSGSSVGTFSVLMNPATPTFAYSGTNLHLSSSGTDSGGVCNGTNGAGNGSFQILSGDTLATNGSLSKQNYSICVAASEPGTAAPTGQVFTITVGHLIDAAATYCAANGGGNGTSASPWHYNCIQAAVNAASTGDTVFLAAGNWVLDTTADAAPVTIDKAISLVGAGSGNTFDTWGHINNPKPTSPSCPTTSSSLTCIYQTGQSYATGSCPGYPWTCPGYIYIGKFQDNTSTDPNCTNVTVTHILFDGSKTTAGGGLNGILAINACAGPVTVNDLRFLASNAESIGGGGISGETQFGLSATNNVTITNSLFADPFVGGGVYSSGQVFQINGANGLGTTYLIQNNAIYQGAYNPIAISNANFLGNQNYTFNDGTGDSGIDPAVGYAGSTIGQVDTCGEATTGVCVGDVNNTMTNNLFYGPNHILAIGVGVNDPGTAGGLSNLSITGNWIISDTAVIDSCEWHYFDNQGNCAPNTSGGLSMILNALPSNTCALSNNGTPWTVTNNSLKGTTAAALDAAGSVSTSGTGTNDWIACNTGPGTKTQIPIRIYGLNAQQNWFSSASNQYVTNANTFSPVQTNNFCVGGVGTVTGCATTGFTTAPTVSFTLGTFSNGIVQFASTSFTAQYGAVQWLTSTSATAPTSSDSRWSSNNGSFPNSAANSYIPPMSLSGVTHGNTVYLWVMDSANHISAAASAVVP